MCECPNQGERRSPAALKKNRIISAEMFGKKKETEPVPVQPAAPAEPVIEAVKEPEVPAEKPVEKISQTVIAAGTSLVGNFDTREPMILLGRLHGNIHSTDSLKIAKSGELLGEAAVSDLSSDGQIEGTVLCSNLTEFGSMAKMKGNLSTASLKTADGSSFEGKLTMITKAAEEIAESAAEALDDSAETAGSLFDNDADAVPIDFNAEEAATEAEKTAEGFTEIIIDKEE